MSDASFMQANQQQHQQRSATPEDGRCLLPMEFHYLVKFHAHLHAKLNSIKLTQSTQMLLFANGGQVKPWKVHQ
jgi:hypothetical protein